MTGRRPLAARLRAWRERLVDATAPTPLARRDDLPARLAAEGPGLAAMSEAELGAAADALRGRYEPDPARLGALLREAAVRTVGLRPFDVQLRGALALCGGRVLEMATGEGKTLVGALAASAHVLAGHRVHVVSVNDYLAQRDAEWMGPLYRLLGIEVGWVTARSSTVARRRAYAADVTYVPVGELGFDLLRDRRVDDVADRVLPAPDVALVDEADSVLVDEAVVPLVLAGAVAGADTDRRATDAVAGLRAREHYETDDEGRTVSLTDAGVRAVEAALDGADLYGVDPPGDGDGDSEDDGGALLAAVNVALHARALLRRDVHYIVRDGAVLLVDASRGRVAHRQRWPDGLQAAVERKEGLAVSSRGEVLDSVTVQAVLARYPTLCGMTGTASAVAEALHEFYGLRVVVAEPHEPCVRVDEPDRVHATAEQRDRALVALVLSAHEAGRPVLVGTGDVAESERLARRLRRAGITPAVLNARHDAEEAAVVAEAGGWGAVTVSTQMAGRGTDIRLGGADGADRERVAEAGGLLVVGTGRHVTRRLDDQLRGRAGRQGDPGSSVLFTSPDDDLVVRYAPATEPPDPEDVGPDGRVTSRRTARDLEHAQRVAEAVHLEIHRNTWRYHQLIDRQRAIVLERRERLLTSDGADGADGAADALRSRAAERYAVLELAVGEQEAARVARRLVVGHLDERWSEHLAHLTDVREGIHLHALARASPIDEFHREAIGAFSGLLDDATARAAATLEAAEITAEGIATPDAGPARPSATWTYLVRENPSGTDLERAADAVAHLVRRRR